MERSAFVLHSLSKEFLSNYIQISHITICSLDRSYKFSTVKYEINLLIESVSPSLKFIRTKDTITRHSMNQQKHMKQRVENTTTRKTKDNIANNFALHDSSSVKTLCFSSSYHAGRTNLVQFVHGMYDDKIFQYLTGIL